MLVSRWSCREKQTGVWSRLRLLSWLGGECGHRRHTATITRLRTGQGLWNNSGGLTTETLPRNCSFYDGVQLLLNVSELTEFSSRFVAAALILVRCTAHAPGEAWWNLTGNVFILRRGRPGPCRLTWSLHLHCFIALQEFLKICRIASDVSVNTSCLSKSDFLASQADGKFHCGISL